MEVDMLSQQILSVDLLPSLLLFTQYWSAELEEMAEEHAKLCKHGFGYEVQKPPGKHAVVGENVGVSFERNITNLIWYWFYEGENYDYETATCNANLDSHTYTCDHYLHVSSVCIYTLDTVTYTACL